MNYIKPLILKGAPALVTDLLSLYEDKEKTKIIEEVLTAIRNNIQKKMEASEQKGEALDKSNNCWLNYFLS